MTQNDASAELQADREVVLAAVRQNGNALWFASEALQADRYVVLEAVREEGLALEYASDELKRKMAACFVKLMILEQDSLLPSTFINEIENEKQ